MIQDTDAQNSLKGNYRRFSVDISGGIPLMHGDIKNKLVGYDVAARLNWNLTSAVSVGTEFAVGNVKGEDKSGEYFSNNYMKALVGGEVYFFNLLKLNQLASWFQPYAGMNVGAIKSDIEDSHNELHYNDWTWAQQFNGGLKFKLTNMMDLNLSANLMFTGADKLDNYSPNYYKNNNRDALSTYKVGLTFHIGKKENSSIIWKNESNPVKFNSEYEDSVKLHTQAKLQDLEGELIMLEKQNGQLNTKLNSKDSKLESTAKEVTQLESELKTIKNEVSVLEGSVKKIDTRATGFSNIETTVYFGTASDALPATEKAKLSEIASFLNANPSAKAMARGYTDKRGSDEYNLSLSLKRAKMVKNYLLGLGIDSSRVETIGLGENHSLPDSLQGSRRVIVTVE